MNYFEIITSLVGLLAVGLIVAIKRRSADKSFRSAVFLRNFLLVTAALIFRQDLQLLVWLILDEGIKTVIDILRFLTEGLSRDIRIILRELGTSFETTLSFSFYLRAILPAAAISIARVTGRTTVRKFTYIIVAAIVTFLLIDLVHPPKLPESRPQASIRFLVIFDAVVGFICGIVFLIFNPFKHYVKAWASGPVKFVQANPKLRALLVCSLIVTIAIIVGRHPVSSKVFLSFTDWKTVKFKYIDFKTDDRFLSIYQAFSGKNLVPETELTWLFVKGQESSLKFNWQAGRKKAKNLTTALQVTRVDGDLPPTFLFRKLFEELRSRSVLYLGEIHPGDISMSLPVFDCWFWPAGIVKGTIRSSGVLYLPRDKLLTAYKEESKSKPPFGEQGPNESTVVIRTEEGHMNFGFGTVGPLSIFCHGSSVSIGDTAFESAWIKAPGLKTAIPITPTERLKGPKTRYYPGILLQLGRADDEIYISSFSPFQEIKIATSNFSFGQGTVEDFFVKAPKGDLKLGTASNKLDGGDEILVKGLDLTLSASRDGATVLEGYSDYVVRNGVVETDTIWSKYKTELAIILTVVVTIIGILKVLPWVHRYFQP